VKGEALKGNASMNRQKGKTKDWATMTHMWTKGKWKEERDRTLTNGLPTWDSKKPKRGRVEIKQAWARKKTGTNPVFV